MRWYFRDEDLAQGDNVGELLRQLFARLKPLLEYDDARCIWIMRRK